MDSLKEAFDFQVVSIVGEQVSFVPTKLSPLETAIVDFDEFYKPEGISEDDFRILKNTMKFLFSKKQKPLGESKETTREPYPPCQEKEKQFVLQSLLHRKRILQQQMFDLGIIMYPEQLQKKINELRNDGKLDEMLRRKQDLPIQGKETLLGDYHLQHWLALDRFIQDYDSQTLCVDVLDISHKDITLDLSDDNIRELLQQFVFFMLQGSHPLPEYKKTDPTSPAFISRLKRNPMGDKFPSYLTTYKSKNLPISPIIAKVLEATNLDPASMRDEVKRLVGEEKKKILIVIQRIIPPTHPIWSSIGDKTDIRQIVETLWQNLQDADALISGLRKEIESLMQRVKNCEKAQELLTVQKRGLENQVRQLTLELTEANDSNLAKTRRIEELEEEKRILEERIRANQAELEEARGKDAIIAQLRTEKQGLEDELREANLELLEEREKVGQLEEEKRLCQEELARVKAELETERGKDAIIASLTADKQALADELEGLRERIAELEAAVEAGKAKDLTIVDLQNQLAALQAQFEDLEGKKTRIEEELARAQADLATTKADLEKEKGKDLVIAGLEAKKQELEGRITDLEAELGPLRGKDIELETLRAEAKEVQDALNQRIAELEREKQECQEALDAKEREYDQLLFENQDLKGEIYAMRAKIEELEELNQKAQQNIEDLRREHQAAIGVEKAKVVASEAARSAAMKSAEDANATLAAKTTELAEAKASLDATKKVLETKDLTIAELRKALAESEAAVTNARGDVQAKAEQIQTLTTEALAANDKIQRLENTIAELRDDMETLRAEKEMVDEDLESKLAQISQLERELAEAQAANRDLQTQLKKCEEEKRVLQQSASGSATSSAELAGKLRVAEEDRAAAESKRGELESLIQSLRRQLEAETARANQAEENTRQQKKTIDDHEETIKYFEHDIAAKQGEIETTGKRADVAEKKVGELESKLTATIAQKDDEITAVKTELQDGFQQQLADQQSEFEKNLRRQTQQLQESLEASAAERIHQTQEEYEAALQQQKENYEKVYAVIQRIATWVDSGEDTGVEEAAAVQEDTPQAGPLRTIVTKLAEVHGAASGSSSPSARRTADSTISLCYIVFLASFLWQANFSPRALEAELHASAAAGNGDDWEALHSGRPVAGIPRLKLLHAILPTVFDGGAKPTKETWASSTSAPAAYAFRQGLYRDIEMRSAGATTKHEFHGKLYSENTIVRRYLHLFNKISRAMESPTADGAVLGLDEIDTVFLDQLVAKFTTIITDYKDVYRTPTFHLETAFPQMISETLRMNQPHVRADVLKHYLVKTRGGYRIVTKEDSEEAPSYLNYATIFYSFLVVIRDYLNHIEGTVYAQCPLPAILRRTKSRK